MRYAYKALLLHPDTLAATCNAAAHILPVTKGYADDWEHGMGQAMHNAMLEHGVTGRVVFITRTYGENKLGRNAW